MKPLVKNRCVGAVFGHLADEGDKEDAMIDSTIVRAHQQSWGAKGGKRSQEAIAGSDGTQ